MSSNRKSLFFRLDFLHTKHNLDHGDALSIFNDGAIGTADDTNNVSMLAVPGAVDASHKSDLEKQADVLMFLHQHCSSGCLSPAVIYKALRIDLSYNGFDHAIVAMV